MTLSTPGLVFDINFKTRAIEHFGKIGSIRLFHQITINSKSPRLNLMHSENESGKENETCPKIEFSYAREREQDQKDLSNCPYIGS